MASSDPDFSESERVALLREVLRTYLQDPNHSSQSLATCIHTLQIQRPVWDNILPPSGRTMGQCKHVYYHKIMSGSPQPQQFNYPGGVTGPQVPAPIPAASQHEFGSSQRPIAPRPMPGATQQLARDVPTSPFSPVPSEPQERRPKRGRPNRLESERRQKEREKAFSEGRKDPYPSRSRKKPRHEQSSTPIIQAPSPHAAVRGTLAPPSTSSFAPSSGMSAFSTGPHAYTSFHRAILPPLQSSGPPLSSIPSFTRPYEPPATSTTRSSYGSTAQSSSPGQLPASLPPTRSLRSYSSDRSPYYPPSTIPPVPSAMTSRASAQLPEEQRRDSNGHPPHISPPSTEPMEQ